MKNYVLLQSLIDKRYWLGFPNLYYILLYIHAKTQNSFEYYLIIINVAYLSNTLIYF